MAKKDRMIQPIPDTMENVVSSLFRPKKHKSKELRALRKGSLKELLGIDIASYVLNDPQETVVILKKDVKKLLGIEHYGFKLQELADNELIQPYLDDYTIQKSSEIIAFNINLPEMKQSTILVPWEGVRLSVILEICIAIIKSNHDGKWEKDELLEHATNFVFAFAGLAF